MPAGRTWLRWEAWSCRILPQNGALTGVNLAGRGRSVATEPDGSPPKSLDQAQRQQGRHHRDRRDRRHTDPGHPGLPAGGALCRCFGCRYGGGRFGEGGFGVSHRGRMGAVGFRRVRGANCGGEQQGQQEKPQQGRIAGGASGWAASGEEVLEYRRQSGAILRVPRIGPMLPQW